MQRNPACAYQLKFCFCREFKLKFGWVASTRHIIKAPNSVKLAALSLDIYEREPEPCAPLASFPFLITIERCFTKITSQPLVSPDTFKPIAVYRKKPHSVQIAASWFVAMKSTCQHLSSTVVFVGFTIYHSCTTLVYITIHSFHVNWVLSWSLHSFYFRFLALMLN